MNTKYFKHYLFVFAFLLVTVILTAQTHPGTEDGLPTPIDGGILMGLLAAGGVALGIIGKKKKKED